MKIMIEIPDAKIECLCSMRDQYFKHMKLMDYKEGVLVPQSEEAWQNYNESKYQYHMQAAHIEHEADGLLHSQLMDVCDTYEKEKVIKKNAEVVAQKRAEAIKVADALGLDINFKIPEWVNDCQNILGVPERVAKTALKNVPSYIELMRALDSSKNSRSLSDDEVAYIYRFALKMASDYAFLRNHSELTVTLGADKKESN